MKYATLGDLVFNTPDTGLEQLDSEVGQDMAEYEYATGKTRVEPVGQTLRRVNIKIKLHNSIAQMGGLFNNDIKNWIEHLEGMVGSGKAYSLILASGVFSGMFYVRNLSSSIKAIMPDGTISKYEGSFELIEAVGKVKAMEDAYIKRENKEVWQEDLKGVRFVTEYEKKNYSDLMKGKKIINPLYAAWQYGKKILL